ncbi:MAG: hypothetical protein ABSD20_12125 [Terriglobales bacterium]
MRTAGNTGTSTDGLNSETYPASTCRTAMFRSFRIVALFRFAEHPEIISNRMRIASVRVEIMNTAAILIA